MLRFLLGLFIVLHGLVHLWYFTLSAGLVKLQPGMPQVGWSGTSWLFTGLLGDANTRFLAALLFGLAALAMLVAGIGFLARTEWWWEAVLGSSIFSAAVILSMWDGSTRLIIEKGAIGFLISLVILAVLLFFRRAALAF